MDLSVKKKWSLKRDFTGYALFSPILQLLSAGGGIDRTRIMPIMHNIYQNVLTPTLIII